MLVCLYLIACARMFSEELLDDVDDEEPLGDILASIDD
jgi:hypothetical protein